MSSEEVQFRVTSAESDGALTAIEVRMPAGGGPPMLHRHDPFELYRVESGEFTIYLAGEGGVERRTAGAGELVAIPAGREHTIRNEGEGEARALVIFSPGEEMERFARRLGALPAGSSPRRVEELAAAHGIEITRRLEAVAR